MRTYAIGDIHGHLDKLRLAQALIAADKSAIGDVAAPIVHIGDLVDRGPDSQGVVAHLMDGIARGEPWVVLKGNHDRMFTGFLTDAWHRDPGLRTDLGWLDARLGGMSTLASYGVAQTEGRPLDEINAEARALVPESHVMFLDALPLYHLAEGVLFVHAGVRPGVDLRDQAEDDLLWIRAEFLDDTRDHGALVVHGHTAIDAATHYGNRLNIDSGAAYGGALSVVVIERQDVWLLTEKGRVPLSAKG